MYKHNKHEYAFYIDTQFFSLFYENLSKFNCGHSSCIKEYFQIIQHTLGDSPRCSGMYY